METFLNIIPIIVPTIVVVGVMVFVSYRNKNAADNHQVRISPVLCIIFNVVLIIGVAFFIFIMLYTNEYPVFIWILFACMLAVDIILLIAFYHFKITYDETGFYYQNSFGRRKRYEYTDVRSFSIGRIYTFYLQDGKKIKLEWGHENKERFLKAVTEGYIKRQEICCSKYIQINKKQESFIKAFLLLVYAILF